MAEIRTVTTLRRKADQIRRTIRDYERRLDQAKADLAHIAAAIHIFEAKGGDTELPAYADIQRLFRYAEGIKLARECLADGPKSTREIAAYIAAQKGLDARDRVINKVICRKIIHMLRRQTEHGLAKSSRRAANLTRSLLELERYLSVLKQSGNLPALANDAPKYAASRRRRYK